MTESAGELGALDTTDWTVPDPIRDRFSKRDDVLLHRSPDDLSEDAKEFLEIAISLADDLAIAVMTLAPYKAQRARMVKDLGEAFDDGTHDDYGRPAELRATWQAGWDHAGSSIAWQRAFILGRAAYDGRDDPDGARVVPKDELNYSGLDELMLRDLGPAITGYERTPWLNGWDSGAATAEELEAWHAGFIAGRQMIELASAGKHKMQLPFPLLV